MIISMLTMIKSESKRLSEWMYFHKKVHDIDRFVFYLDNPEDNSENILISMKDKYNIEIFHPDTKQLGWTDAKSLSAWVSRQKICLTEGFKYLKDKSDFVCIIDVDEFIVPNQDKNLKDILQNIDIGLYIPMYFFRPPFDISKSVAEQCYYRVSDEERGRLGYGASGKSATNVKKYNGEVVNAHHVEFTKEVKYVDSTDFKIHHFRSQMNIIGAKYEIFDNSITRYFK